MPIQIPFHSQASPGVVPNAGTQAMPGGFGALQQSARLPLNDQRASADMFSGGLQGLQAVGNMLGDVGQGFYQIASQLRAVDDYNTETELIGALDTAKRSVGQYVSEHIDPSPGEYEAFADEAMMPVRALLEKDMPAAQRAKLQRMVALGGAAVKGEAYEAQGRIIRSKGLRNAELQNRIAQDNGDRSAIRPIWERAHALGLVDQAGMEAEIYMGEQAASRAEIERETALDPIAVRDALEVGGYPHIEGADRVVALKKAHADINFKQAVAAENINLHYANTGELPTTGELDHLVEIEMMDPKDRDYFVSESYKHDVGLAEFAEWQQRLYSLDPNDASNASLMLKERLLNNVAATGDEAAHKALTDIADDHWSVMKGEKKDLATGAFKVIDAKFKGLTGIGDGATINATSEKAIANRQTVNDLKSQITAYIKKTPNVTHAMMEAELSRIMGGKVEVVLPRRFGNPLPPPPSKVPTPPAAAPPAMRRSAGWTTPKAPAPAPTTTTSASGSFSADPRTRDVIGKKSTQGARLVSLDFNDTDGAGGKASYSTIVIPDDATNEERVAAMSYTAKVTEFFAKHGHVMKNKGPVTRASNGRGIRGQFHTEPFFVGDAAARKIIEENPDEYAKILADTLGQIPGVTFIAPHDKVNPGAAQKGRPEFNERDFAKTVLIPALLKY